MVTSVILPQPVPGAAAIIWAHRGASADAPENTLAAFALAQDQQADGIELDTYRSADGDVVVIHGQTLDRTFPGATGEVTSCTTAQLEALGVPTLAQVLEATTIPINVELKDTSVRDQGLPAAAATQVLRSGASDRVVFSSFNPVGLLGVREVLPEAELAVLLPEQGLSVLPQAVEMFGGKPTEDPYAWLVDNAIPTVHLHRDSIDRATVSACAERGLHVRAWTVDDPERAAELVGLGVRDLITNRPAMIRQALAAR
ncbi:glycerophosphodiester phosphodiesterase [Parenemella sanctibonifatiensis]|nr:glycerophosphodiester phosphodiesterase [Parenemella sanctibonifatiensis]